MTVTNFDRSNIKTMRAEVEAALKLVGDKHGLVINIGRILFGANDFRCKMTAVTKSSVPNTPSGAAPFDPRRAVEAAALQRAVYMLGLTQADLLKDFSNALVGGTCKFIGYAARRHKYPFTIRTSRGKTLKVGVAMAKLIASNPVVKAA